MKEEKIVMYESPEAASIQTVTGWVSRLGHYFGDNEHIARYDGSTHKVCAGCGGIVARSGYCQACRSKRDDEAFHALPAEPWDGTTPVFSHHLEKYFFGGELEDYLADEEVDVEGLQLVHCTPVHLRQIDDSTWEDELSTEDDYMDLPEAVQVALDALNEAIKAAPAVTWLPGKIAVLLPIAMNGAE